ncbi:MAG: FtsX-like permease family protein [Eubacterium sp.]|nr:FtsX-like permease family protein [Eubacterium sp.]
MRIGFYPKLAASNMKKNRKTYFPYVLTCILTIAMFYVFKSLALNPGIEKMFGGSTIVYILELGSFVVALFAFVFLFYTNSFLIKRRKKEFGVFNILGMEKRHLALVLGWETLYVFVISLSAGLAFGIAVDKLMFLLLGKLIGAQVILGFFISIKVIVLTVKLAAVIFLLIFANAVCQIHIAKPVELLRDSSAGEKEPKTKWLMAAAGLICIGSGYYIAITTENPIASIFAFFIAVLLVIIGTYFLFTAGSIAFLKLLRKNKGYYYKTRHFISVSGMIYRMKQNAVGLANICILSTMVLVMVSSTSSMMVGMEDILNTRYTSSFMITSHETEKEREEEVVQTIRMLQNEKKIDIKNETEYPFLDFSAFCQGDTFTVERNASITAIDSSYVLFFMILDDYNRIEGTQKTLKDGEILIYSNRKSYEEPVLHLFDKKYKVAEKLDHFKVYGILAANMSNAQFIVVPDMGELQEICAKQQEVYGEISTDISRFYGFDSDADEETQKQFYYELVKALKSRNLNTHTESRAEARMDFASLYGGLFFIGIFLAVLFVTATVLIIYYKQISEGYDDKDRFAIMKKVGMDQREVKAAIRSQVLTVFFLPLFVAGIHVMAAFPLISRLLALLNFVNSRLYIMCTGISFLVFAGMYVIIYVLTARVYYRIVSR